MDEDFKLEPWGKIFKNMGLEFIKKVWFIAKYILLFLGFLIFTFIFSGTFIFFGASENIVFLSVIISFFLYLFIYGFVLCRLSIKRKNKD